MTPDYSPKQYYTVIQTNLRREVIDALLQELHVQHEQMIERALKQSDMQQARDIINWIKEKS
jgi:hypothetical protein